MKKKSTPCTDVFKFSRLQQKRIIDSLRAAGLKAGIDRNTIIREVTAGARDAITRHVSATNYPRPYASKILKELHELSKGIDAVLAAFEQIQTITILLLDAHLDNPTDVSHPWPGTARVQLYSQSLFLRLREVSLSRPVALLMILAPCFPQKADRGMRQP